MKAVMLQRIAGLVASGALACACMAQPRGNCLLLTGQGEYVKVIADSSLDNTNSLTVAGWAYMVSQPAHAGFISKAGSDDEFNVEWRNTSSYSFKLGRGTDSDNDKFEFNLSAPRDSTINAQEGKCNTATLPLGKWIHAAGVYDGSATRLYLDGALVKTCAGFSGDLVKSGCDLFLGCDVPGSPEYWTGAVDEVMVWNRALPAAEIAKAMACDTAGITTGMAGYWPFDEGVGSTVHNLAPATYGRNNGTVYKWYGAPPAVVPNPAWKGINPANINALVAPNPGSVGTLGRRSHPRVAKAELRVVLSDAGILFEVISPGVPQGKRVSPSGRVLARADAWRINRK